MNAWSDFLAADTVLRAILIAGSFGTAVVMARYFLREMYNSRAWQRFQHHWDD